MRHLATFAAVLATATLGCEGRDEQCDALAFEATQLVGSGQACAEDADCRAVSTTDEGAGGDSCGALSTFVGQGCAVGVGPAFREDRYRALKRDYFARGCRRLALEDCGPPPPAHCEKEEGAEMGRCVAGAAIGCSRAEEPDAGEAADASEEDAGT